MIADLGLAGIEAEKNVLDACGAGAGAKLRFNVRAAGAAVQQAGSNVALMADVDGTAPLKIIYIYIYICLHIDIHIYIYTQIYIYIYVYYFFPMFPIFVPHFRSYEVASLHRCVLPYKYPYAQCCDLS